MNRKGFTLIEMLVVIAIISILAGVVLTGVGGFQANARDTKRIGDLRIVQGYLEQYYSRFNHYPGDNAGAVSDIDNWAGLKASLEGALGVKLPNDPITTRNYKYGTNNVTEITAYVLEAKLEKDNPNLTAPQTVTSADIPSATWTNLNGIDCVTASKNYCVGSGS